MASHTDNQQPYYFEIYHGSTADCLYGILVEEPCQFLFQKLNPHLKLGLNFFLWARAGMVWLWCNKEWSKRHHGEPSCLKTWCIQTIAARTCNNRCRYAESDASAAADALEHKTEISGWRCVEGGEICASA